MADQLMDTLKATVDKLEKRIEDLESRLQGNSSSSGGHGSSDGMRMILIGPPGAGMSATTIRCQQGANASFRLLTFDLSFRQGHTGPEDQGEVWLLPPRNRRHAPRASRS